MIFSSILVSSVITICLCVPNEPTLVSTGHSESLPIPVFAVNPKQHSGDYLAALQAKCETDKHLLTSFEKECCLKIANAKPSGPISIIKQNTNILQVTNAMDQSLFKTLLRYFADNHGSYNDVSDESAVKPEPADSTMGGQDLEHCLKAKALCLEDLRRASLHCQQDGGSQDEIDTLKAAVKQQTALRVQRENEVQLLELGREADRKEIARLSKELESAVQRLLSEETKTTNLMLEQEQRKSKLEAVGKELEQCTSSLTLAKQNLLKEGSNLASCKTELAKMQAEQKTVAILEQQSSKLVHENEQLRKELELKLNLVSERDAQLKKCAEFEPRLMTCETHLGHCQSNISLTDGQWRSKYVECSTNLNISEARLSKSKESVTQLQNVVLQLEETGRACRENYTNQKEENDLLQSKNANLAGQLAALETVNMNQAKDITYLEKELKSCVSHSKDIQATLTNLKTELQSQIESYNRLQARYREQSNMTMSEKQAKEVCLSQLEELEGDYKKCNQRLEEERAKLQNLILQAGQCAADHTSCKQQLAIAIMQIQNCSSTDALASWKNLHEQCVGALGECNRTKTELTGALKVEEEQNAGCQEKLASCREGTEQCQTANKQLLNSLKTVSEAHSDVQMQLQGLTEQEADCRAKLADATQALALYKTTDAERQAAHDQCLVKTKELAERVGSLEGTVAELNAAHASLSKKYEDCEQERLKAVNDASSLNITAQSCHQKLSALYIEINAFKIEINECLHAGNLTRANVTEWQRLHESCQRSVDEATEQRLALARQLSDLQASFSSLQVEFTSCQGQLQLLTSERKGLLIEVSQYQVTTSLVNHTATECAAELERKTAEALQYQAADLNTNRLLLECMTTLTACQNPSGACPPTTGNNSYWDVDLTIARDNLTSTEELTGCAMASNDRGESSSMRTFCYKQNGRLLRVADQEAVLMAYDYIQTREGKFLVEPSAYFANSLGFDLKQYASDAEVCYYIERTSTFIPQLKHEKCGGHVYNAMCWAAYRHGYDNYTAIEPQTDSVAVQPDYLDFIEF